MTEQAPKLPPGLRLITDEPEQTKPDNSAALKILLVALGALSQRMVIALADLFGLAAVGSVFWLCLTMTSPTPYQLAQQGMYSVFVLACVYLVKRR